MATLDINTGIAYKIQTFRQRIVKRHGSMKDDRRPFDIQVKEIKELYRPDLVRGEVGKQVKGGFGSPKIIEGTAPHAAIVWQRGFYGGMVSRKSDWFRDRLIEPPYNTGVVFKGNDEVNQYLQHVDEHMRGVYRRSNFYDVQPSFVLDGGTTGSPVMLRERDYENDRIVCKVPDCEARWLSKDIFGYDNVLHVEWEWDCLQALEFFNEDDLPKVVRTALTNGNHYQKFKYLQVIYPSYDKIFDDLPKGEEQNITHPWMEYFICLDASEGEDENILRPKKRGNGYFTRPFSTWHYWRNWHESYGKSMAWWAIYDVKGNNKYWEAIFGEADLSLKPPTWAMGALKGLLQLGPAGENYAVDENDYKNPPQFIERPTRWQAAMEFADRLAASQKRHFHNDIFMGATDLAMNRNQPETAYGHWLMESERNVQLLPMVETYENQTLKDNHEAFIESEIMAEPAYPWGRLPEPPDIVKEYSPKGGNDVEFIGTLSRAQERDVVLGRFLKGVGVSEMLYDFKPELVEKIDWSQSYERVMEGIGWPQGEIVPEEDFRKILDGIRQRQAQAELAEQAPKLAQAAKALQGKTEEGSPLKELAALPAG